MSASFDLGFLVFLNYEDDAGARASLDDGLRIFAHAERLGYDSGSVRVHHGVRTLTSPFPFLTAAALRTSRIRLGTAVIPAGYEDPLRFAEDAATTDLLAGGRLELALSAGIPNGSAGGSIAIDATDASEPAVRAHLIGEKLAAILSAVRGEPLGPIDTGVRLRPAAADTAPARPSLSDGGDVAPLPHGPVAPPAELVALPRSPGLDERLWYGSGSLASALRAARLGLDLVLSTIHGEATGPTLGHTQADLIRRYRAEFARHHPHRSPRVAIGRSILPILDDADRREFSRLAEFYDRLVTPDGRYTDSPDWAGQASPLYAGDPAEIIERLASDPSLELVDELVLTPLSELTTEQKLRVFGSVAEHVAPRLGWRRSARSDASLATAADTAAAAGVG